MKANILIISMTLLIAIVTAEEPMVVGTIPGLDLDAVIAAQQDSQTPPGGWGDWGLAGENELTGKPGATDEPMQIGTVPGLYLGAVIAAQENVNSAPSNIHYVGGSGSIPQSYCLDTCGYPFEIERNGAKSLYASIPQYSNLNLITNLSTAGGKGEILELYPSTSNQGTYVRTQYNFNPGGNIIPYRGDVLGRHYLLFTLNDQASNVVIIDVGGSSLSGTLGGSPSVTPIQLPGPTGSA